MNKSTSLALVICSLLSIVSTSFAEVPDLINELGVNDKAHYWGLDLPNPIPNRNYIQATQAYLPTGLYQGYIASRKDTCFVEVAADQTTYLATLYNGTYGTPAAKVMAAFRIDPSSPVTRAVEKNRAIGFSVINPIAQAKQKPENKLRMVYAGVTGAVQKPNWEIGVLLFSAADAGSGGYVTKHCQHLQKIK